MVLAVVLILTTWFAGAPAGLAPVVPFVACLLLALARLLRARPSIPQPASETLLCLALAVLYRLPALLHPWGFVNKDGAYGAFVALHLVQGVRPAPVFTEGANYQGTLKGHLAALLWQTTGARDLSLLMVLASLLLFLVFLVASMALARRVGGRGAALVTGLCLAVGPRFLTVFSLNCVGQYVDVLALGGVALAVLARMLDTGERGPAARGDYVVVGFLLGAAFWQQPVALSYLVTVGLILAVRRDTWTDPWTLLVGLGLLVGALPVLLWNVQNGWATGDIVGRDATEIRAQVEALLHLIRRTWRISFPILAGLSPDHPWGDVPGLRPLVAALPPLLLVGHLAVHGRAIAAGLRHFRPVAALLPPLLMTVCLVIFWSIASGRVYWRPRYLLPVMAATVVHLGVLGAALARRSRVAAAAGLGLLLALNARGTVPRLLESKGLADSYARLVRSLEDKGIRTGYSDFSISAPVTMFTSERIVLSPRLGPTPAYESELHAQRVDQDGPDAYVLLPEDDPELFAALLRSLGVDYRRDLDPVPVFYGFSRRVRLEEVAGFRGPGNEPAGSPTGEE